MKPEKRKKWVFGVKITNTEALTKKEARESLKLALERGGKFTKVTVAVDVQGD